MISKNVIISFILTSNVSIASNQLHFYCIKIITNKLILLDMDIL
jgi:hypothetical protein